MRRETRVRRQPQPPHSEAARPAPSRFLCHAVLAGPELGGAARPLDLPDYRAEFYRNAMTRCTDDGCTGAGYSGATPLSAASTACSNLRRAASCGASARPRSR